MKKLAGFRDPYVWREGEKWYMVIGSGIREKKWNCFFYMKAKHCMTGVIKAFYTREVLSVVIMWECPNFLKMEKDVLVVSPIPLGYPIYFIGEQKKFEVLS